MNAWQIRIAFWIVSLVWFAAGFIVGYRVGRSK